MTAVSQAAIDAIKPFVSAPVWSAIQLQMLTGMRSGEVLAMRGCDINTSGSVWEYRPASHKGEHHGKGRIVFLGPKAQAIVKAMLTTELQAFLFNPAAQVSPRPRRPRLSSRRLPPCNYAGLRACFRHAARVALSRAQDQRTARGGARRRK